MIDVSALMMSIRAGEDTELELKEVQFRGNRVLFARDGGRAAPRLAEVFVSMANTNGGLVVLGVRDHDHLPVGINPGQRELVEQLVVNAATENCLPMIVPGLTWEYLPGAEGAPALCLIVEIPRSPHEIHQTSDGRFLQRIGSHRRVIPAERLARMLSGRRMTNPIEERPVFGSTLEDLHDLRLERYFRDRFADWTRPDDWPRTLLAHKLAAATDGGVTPTHLGVLLFAERPEQFLPGAYVDVAAYRHDTPDGETIDSTRITGPLPEQIAQALTYFRSSALVPTASRKDWDGRHDYPSYSSTALQEAVVNAIVHRDYEARGSQIIIRLFADRIEFQNPGALYNTLTVENLYAGCQPARRNQFLAGFMRDYRSPLTGASYMEARGEGFLKLVRDSERLSGRRPLLEQIGDATRLTIYATRPPAPLTQQLAVTSTVARPLT